MNERLTTLSDAAMYVGIAGIGYNAKGLSGASVLLFTAGIVFSVANRLADE